MRQRMSRTLGHGMTSVSVATCGGPNKVTLQVAEEGGGGHVTLTLVLVGGVVGVVMAVSIIFLLKRHSRSREKLAHMAAGTTPGSATAGGEGGLEASKDYQDLCRQRMQSKASEKPEPLHAASRIGSLTDSQVRSPSSRSSTPSWSEEPAATNMDISTGHVVLAYMEDHLKNGDRLGQEWEALAAYQADPSNTAVGGDPANARRNRYTDVMPCESPSACLSVCMSVCVYVCLSDGRNPANSRGNRHTDVLPFRLTAQSLPRRSGNDRLESGKASGNDRLESGKASGNDRLESGKASGNDRLESGKASGNDRLESGKASGNDRLESGKASGNDRLESGKASGNDRLESGKASGNDRLESGKASGNDRLESGKASGNDRLESGKASGNDRLESGKANGDTVWKKSCRESRAGISSASGAGCPRHGHRVVSGVGSCALTCDPDTATRPPSRPQHGGQGKETFDPPSVTGERRTVVMTGRHSSPASSASWQRQARWRRAGADNYPRWSTAGRKWLPSQDGSCGLST
ncbi:hypothetical protein ACOMHN_034721 [Nucella lapillus]